MTIFQPEVPNIDLGPGQRRPTTGEAEVASAKKMSLPTPPP
jgi:hypothetical protein